MDISKIIKERRQLLGISQDKLATHLGFDHRSTVSRLEKGNIKWKWDDAIKAIHFLGMDIDIK